MPHSDAIVHSDGIEFPVDSAGLPNGFTNQSPHFCQVNVTGHELGKAIGYGDNGLAKILTFHPCRSKQRSGASA
jgi:hypothetical protein